MIAIEAALPALEESRRPEDWVGWAYWARALEQAGHRVPPEKRSDLRYMIRATIDLPKQWGPLKGLPRNPKPLLRLLDETTLPEDYRQVGTLTLERVGAIETPVVLVYTEQSAFIDTFEYLEEHLPNVARGAAAEDRVGPLRAAGAARAWWPRRDRRAARPRPRAVETEERVMRGIDKGRPGQPGDVVIVTGSGTGIGLETALQLAGDGFRVFATVRNLDQRVELRGCRVRARRDARGAEARPHRPREHRRGARRGPRRGRRRLRARQQRRASGLRGCTEDCAEEEIRQLFETNVLGHDRGHPGGDPAHARGGLRADRHHLLGRRAACAGSA